MEPFPIPAPAFNGNSRGVAAGNSFEWLKQGWALFVANPGIWIAITIMLLVFFLSLQIVPVVGSLAAHMLTPVFAAGLLWGCRKVADGEKLEITDLFIGFKKNSGNLVSVGVLYMVGMLCILMVGVVLGGGSMAGGLVMGRAAGAGVALGGMLLAMLVSLVLTVPLFMGIWFAPALVLFNNMHPVDAIKASFNACLKNVVPFLVFWVITLVLIFFAALPVGLGFLVLVPVLAGAVYASYRDIFIAN